MFGCQITLGYYPFIGNLGVGTGQKNLTLVGFELMTFKLDFLMLFRCSMF